MDVCIIKPREGVYSLDLTSKESKKVFSGLIELASFDQNNNSLYSVDPLFEKITIVKGDRVIGTIKINDLFTKNSMPPPKGHKRFFKGQSIYSPTEFRYIASEEAYFQSESYTKEILVINIDTEKIVTIPSKGKEFGYYILGIDKKGNMETIFWRSNRRALNTEDRSIVFMMRF